MAEIINLRMARKARSRAQAEQQAAENRAKFGRTKAEKVKARSEAQREARALDGVKREGESDGSER
jgi:hypothetical protein